MAVKYTETLTMTLQERSGTEFHINAESTHQLEKLRQSVVSHVENVLGIEIDLMDQGPNQRKFVHPNQNQTQQPTLW